MIANNRRVLVTGGGTFLGDNITAALLAEGADVTLLVRPGAETRLGPLAQRVRWWIADVWDAASMRGRARGHGVVIHTVGGMVADTSRGLSHHRLNFVSTRNAATLCVSDGVPRMLLLSTVRAPWLSASYVQSKREAEQYLARVGVNGVIIRAPVTYVRGSRRHGFFQMMTLLGSIPVVSWFRFGRIAPMPIDILARGVARIALNPQAGKSLYFANDLRRLNHRGERELPQIYRPQSADATPMATPTVRLVDEDTPFGWSPQDRN